jgi:hypothetical protein
MVGMGDDVQESGAGPKGEGVKEDGSSEEDTGEGGAREGEAKEGDREEGAEGVKIKNRTEKMMGYSTVAVGPVNLIEISPSTSSWIQITCAAAARRAYPGVFEIVSEHYQAFCEFAVQF